MTRLVELPFVERVRTKLNQTDIAHRAQPTVNFRVVAEAQAVRATSWGRFPLLCFSNSLALILIALAYTGSRRGSDWASAVYWLGLLVIFAPTAIRLVQREVARKERIALVVLLGCSLYIVKVLHSPLDFTFYDEFLHWQTANNILQTHFLFTENSLLPVSPLYPGLEIITTAFANLSGLSVVEAGILLLGVAREALMLALYLFFERISGSEQVGGIAALLYTANSNFLLFDSQFSYETLSLPIATTVLYLVASQTQDVQNVRRFLTHFMLALPLIVMVAITHHLTAYVLAGFLGLWTFAALLRNRLERHWIALGAFTLAALVSVIGWTALVGNSVASYLGPVFRSGINELLGILNLDSTGRELFQSASGINSPLWERAVGIASIVCILLMLPAGAFQIIFSPFRRYRVAKQVTVLPASALQNWFRYRHSAAALALAALVVLHPVMQGFRLTSSGWEIANRSSEFLFWAIAFILAVGVLLIGSLKLPRRLWLFGFAAWAGIIFVGGAISGWPPWARLPGSYLVSADTRSIEPEGILAARWVGQNLPAYSRIGTDRINSLLVSVYGNQRAITHLADGVYLAPVFFSHTFGSPERTELILSGAQYLLVDERMSTNLPLVGVYFEAGEPSINEGRSPIDGTALAKFDHIPHVSRIFDSGDIRLYDMGGIYAAP
jgi:hypothetical protein